MFIRKAFVFMDKKSLAVFISARLFNACHVSGLYLYRTQCKKFAMRACPASVIYDSG